MRYFPLLILLPLSISTPLAASPAVAPPVLLSQTSNSTQDFWTQSQRLVQAQLDLITQVQRVLAGRDFRQVEAARRQIIVQSEVVERFLRSQYRAPNLLCSNGTNTPDIATNLSKRQRQVYCALYTSTQQLKPVISALELRLPMLASLEPLPKPLNYREPNPSIPQPPVIGFPTKPATSEDLPFQPVTTPPDQVTAPLSSARKQLLSVLRAFPASNRITDPTPNTEIIDRATYGLLPTESQAYAKFLAQPNTGIARVLPAVGDRLQSTVAERFPFVPLATSTSGLTSRFTLQLANGNFQLPLPELNYGFMVNVGKVSLENLKPTLRNARISQEQRRFFLDYSPPNRLEALQVDRLRLFTGKDRAGLVPPVNPPVSTEAPAVLNNTYLLRLVQFQLPGVILNREPISRSQRRYLNQILETPSSDVLVAFRPVSQRTDGSYIVLWRLLKQFPDPKIQDLDNYVELD